MSTANGDVERRLTSFCMKRVAEVLPPAETERIRSYMLSLWSLRQMPPLVGSGLNWTKIAADTEIAIDHLRPIAAAFGPGFDALRRALRSAPTTPKSKLATAARTASRKASKPPYPGRRKPGPVPHPIVE